MFPRNDFSLQRVITIYKSFAPQEVDTTEISTIKDFPKRFYLVTVYTVDGLRHRISTPQFFGCTRKSTLKNIYILRSVENEKCFLAYGVGVVLDGKMCLHLILSGLFFVRNLVSGSWFVPV